MLNRGNSVINPSAYPDARQLKKERLVENRLKSRDSSPAVTCFAFQFKAVGFFFQLDRMGLQNNFYEVISYRYLSPCRRSLDFPSGVQGT